jgi:hypothetical protein
MSPDGWSRREADIAERDRRRLKWAESGPKGAASGSTGVRAEAEVATRLMIECL